MKKADFSLKGIHHGFASAVGIELGSAGAAWMVCLNSFLSVG